MVEAIEIHTGERCATTASVGLVDRADLLPSTAMRYFSQHCYENRLEDAVAYVINEPCITTKDISCVEVCPVDCIHPTPDEPGFAEADQLYIDPEECIDCDACVEACPVDAITSEDQTPDEWRSYIKLNADYYARAAK